MQQYKGIVLFGPPGVGKGAQADILKKSHGLVHLSTGDLIREEIKQGTDLGRRVQDAVNRGQLADDETVIGIVMSRIDRSEFQAGFIMDGFPRTVVQAEMFDRILAERGRKVTHAVFIIAPDEVVLRRLGGRLVCGQCGATYNEAAKPPRTAGVCDACKGPVARRKDDDPKTQKERLVAYQAQTTPLVEYYHRSGVLVKVNGDQTIEGVAAEIAGAVGKAAPAEPVHQQAVPTVQPEEGRSKPMLTKTMQDALNEQIKHELYSAYLYLSMAAYCESINLPGMAHWMRVQHAEETGHAMKFFEHVFDRGGRVILQAIEKPPAEFRSAQDVFEKTLEHEKKVTGLIHHLYAQALRENDYASLEMLQWFVKEQVEEEKNAGQILEQLKMVGDKGAGLIMLDRHLASRGK